MKHSKCTKSNAVKHMNSLENESLRLSRVATLNLIDDFESRRIIRVEKPSRRGQAHQLIINEQNIFNSINDWITEIEAILQIVHKNYDIALRLWQENIPENMESPKGPDDEFLEDYVPKELNDLLRHYAILRDVSKMMIDVLLLVIYSKVNSNEDRVILSLRIMKPLVKTLKYTLQPAPPLTLVQLCGYSNFTISESAKTYGKKVGMDIDILPSLSEKIASFEKRFLGYRRIHNPKAIKI